MEPQSSASFADEHPSKRRKTSAAPNLIQIPWAASPTQNGPVTYSKRSKSTFSSPLPIEPIYAATETGPLPLHEAIWNLEGTMRESYAHHDPLAMFPEPSSTVANATQTQLHIMEGVRAPVMLGVSSEVDVPRNLLPPEPSVPWSDIMKLTPGEPLYQSESSIQEGSTSDSTSATPIPGGAEVVSLASGFSTHQKGSQLQHDVTRANSRALVSLGEPDKHSPSTKPLGCSAVSRDISQTRKPSSLSTPQDELRNEASFEYDDDLSIGLPQEQYKPRPSRSRSLKADTQDTIDYSVVPERAKKVSQRRKTAKTDSNVEIPTTPQKIQQICDMGFTPNTTKRALQQNSGDVTSTVDWLVTNRIGEDELASHSTPRKKPGIPKSRAMAMDPEGLQVIMRELNEYRKDDSVPQQSDVAAPVAAHSTLQPESIDVEHAVEHGDTVPVKSPRVQIIIQKKSAAKTSSTVQKPSEPPKKSSKRRKTTLDQPDSEPSTASLELPVLVSEKKKGRGRPKKVLEKATSADLVQETSLQEASEEQQHEALQAVEVNVASRRLPATDVVANSAALEDSTEAVDHPLVPVPLTRTDKTPAKSQTPEASLKPPTPSTNGKVPYRVGLSKRARIAPLLRVLKK
ncbi:hypothetical protein J1614_008932 [Plenodomus biglobosus]|nr:hypothetical protein J1614_008932 [Plenodomus biglobosus]